MERAKYSAALSNRLERAVSTTPDDAPAVVAKYRKIAEDSLKLVDKIESELDEAVMRGTAYRAEAMQHARYAKLQDLVHQGGYILDVAGELKDFGLVDDEAFDRHVERIKASYQRVPLRGLPIMQGGVAGSPQAATPSEDDRKRLSTQASHDVYEARQRGENLTYDAALKAVYKKAGKALPGTV